MSPERALWSFNKTTILSGVLMHIFYMQKNTYKKKRKKKTFHPVFLPLYFIPFYQGTRISGWEGKQVYYQFLIAKKAKDEAWMKNHLCKIKSLLQMYFKRAATLRCWCKSLTWQIVNKLRCFYYETAANREREGNRKGY